MDSEYFLEQTRPPLLDENAAASVKRLVGANPLQDRATVEQQRRSLRAFFGRDDMLRDNDAIATIAVQNIDRAKAFYGERLRLKEKSPSYNPSVVTYGRRTVRAACLRIAVRRNEPGDGRNVGGRRRGAGCRRVADQR